MSGQKNSFSTVYKYHSAAAAKSLSQAVPKFKKKLPNISVTLNKKDYFLSGLLINVFMTKEN